MLDQLTLDYAESLFKQWQREIYDQEETDLEVVKKNCTRNGMVLRLQYVTEVGNYLVKRVSKLAYAKTQLLMKAAKRAGLPFDDSVLGDIMSRVMDFCDKQQQQEVAFLAQLITQPWLITVSREQQAAVKARIQTGVSAVMEAVKDSVNATRLETMLDARNNQAVYASALGKRWDVFISHASEDKESFVEPLANALGASGLNVWYDKTALTVGDRLRHKIDEGLSQSRYGVVVLSHNFFAKQWPKEELEGLFAREVNGAPGIKVILPVWHSISASEVTHYSPMLAGRFAANSNSGIDAVVRELRQAMYL